MKTSDFHYDLDESLIAQKPIAERDASRLLVYDRNKGETEHGVFSDITKYFKCGDVLVLNDTKVLPARLMGTKSGTERICECLLLRRLSLTDWEVLLRPGKKLKIGDTLVFRTRFALRCKARELMASQKYAFILPAFLNRYSIHWARCRCRLIYEKLEDKTRYQTVYAAMTALPPRLRQACTLHRSCSKRLSKKASKSCV